MAVALDFKSGHHTFCNGHLFAADGETDHADPVAQAGKFADFRDFFTLGEIDAFNAQQRQVGVVADTDDLGCPFLRIGDLLNLDEGAVCDHVRPGQNRVRPDDDPRTRAVLRVV